MKIQPPKRCTKCNIKRKVSQFGFLAGVTPETKSDICKTCTTKILRKLGYIPVAWDKLTPSQRWTRIQW